jgi:hypothetical protein
MHPPKLPSHTPLRRVYRGREWISAALNTSYLAGVLMRHKLFDFVSSLGNRCSRTYALSPGGLSDSPTGYMDFSAAIPFDRLQWYICLFQGLDDLLRDKVRETSVK